ncbi:MAG: spore coat protein CotJB [Defluviitaleaceae bacterium]|nr:spore coat protein CotJB [Defluviitaleaceae bacterium]
MSHDSLSLPLAYPFVPPQRFINRYSDEDAITRGTLFPELDLPFHDYQIKNPLPKTQMTELMMLDFVYFELRLYLDTHPEDITAMELYNEYKLKATEARQKLQSSLDSHYYNSWVYSPWPWEGDV